MTDYIPALANVNPDSFAMSITLKNGDSMSTNDLSRAMLYLAYGGTNSVTNKEFLTQAQAKRVNAIILTCGHYDASGRNRRNRVKSFNSINA